MLNENLRDVECVIREGEKWKKKDAAWRRIEDTVAVAVAIPDLDQWLAAPALRTSHRRVAAVDAETLWRAALAIKLRDCRLLGPLVRLRLGLPDTELTFAELFRGPPLVVLDGGPTWALSGLCGRIWSARGVLGDVGDPQAFRDWSQPGTVRVLFAHWVETVADGGGAVQRGARESDRPSRRPLPARARAVHRRLPEPDRRRAARARGAAGRGTR